MLTAIMWKFACIQHPAGEPTTPREKWGKWLSPPNKTFSNDVKDTTDIIYHSIFFFFFFFFFFFLSPVSRSRNFFFFFYPSRLRLFMIFCEIYVTDASRLGLSSNIKSLAIATCYKRLQTKNCSKKYPSEKYSPSVSEYGCAIKLWEWLTDTWPEFGFIFLVDRASHLKVIAKKRPCGHFTRGLVIPSPGGEFCPP